MSTEEKTKKEDNPVFTRLRNPGFADTSWETIRRVWTTWANNPISLAEITNLDTEWQRAIKKLRAFIEIPAGATRIDMEHLRNEDQKYISSTAWQEADRETKDRYLDARRDAMWPYAIEAMQNNPAIAESIMELSNGILEAFHEKRQAWIAESVARREAGIFKRLGRWIIPTYTVSKLDETSHRHEQAENNIKLQVNRAWYELLKYDELRAEELGHLSTRPAERVLGKIHDTCLRSYFFAFGEGLLQGSHDIFLPNPRHLFHFTPGRAFAAQLEIDQENTERLIELGEKSDEPSEYLEDAWRRKHTPGEMHLERFLHRTYNPPDQEDISWRTAISTTMSTDEPLYTAIKKDDMVIFNEGRRQCVTVTASSILAAFHIEHKSKQEGFKAHTISEVRSYAGIEDGSEEQQWDNLVRIFHDGSPEQRDKILSFLEALALPSIQHSNGQSEPSNGKSEPGNQR